MNHYQIETNILPQQARILLKKNWEYYQKINKENQKKRKILQENKYITYDNKTKQFIPIKKYDICTTEETSLNSRKLNESKNNITVRKVNSKIKKEIINLSKNKTSKKKNEKKKHLNSSKLNVLDYSKFQNLSQKINDNSRINYENISYDINNSQSRSNTRNKKFIRLNTLPSLYFSNDNFHQKKSERKITKNINNKFIDTSLDNNNNNLIKGKLVLSSCSNFYQNNNKNNVKLLEDISFDLNQTYVKLWKDKKNNKNLNNTSINFSNEFKDRNSSFNNSKKTMKRRETKASSCYSNTNTSNTKDEYLPENKFNNYTSVEEIHIAFVELIQNQNNLINNQENKKSKKNFNEFNNSYFNDNNSFNVIYVEEQDL